MTDTERLDRLEREKKGYGKGWVCRDSHTGRGIRIYESSREWASPTIREAIDNYLLTKGY